MTRTFFIDTNLYDMYVHWISSSKLIKFKLTSQTKFSI
jgi:hypothetical protein